MSGSLRRKRALRGGLLRLGIGALALLWVQSGSALAAPDAFTDPDDVDLRLDIRSVEHLDDGQSVTYRVVTYEAFRDDFADFVWHLDIDADGLPDLLVSAAWDDEAGPALVGKVETLDEVKVADADVSRPTANALEVSFASRLLGSASSYDYSLTAVSDYNGDGEAGGDERDLAPDSGSRRHRVGAASPATRQPVTQPVAPPVAEPAPRAAAPSPAPAPEPVVAPAPGPEGEAATAAPGSGDAASLAPAARPGAAPATARPSPGAPAAPSHDRELPRTGSPTLLAAAVGAASVATGASLLASGKRRTGF